MVKGRSSVGYEQRGKLQLQVSLLFSLVPQVISVAFPPGLSFLGCRFVNKFHLFPHIPAHGRAVFEHHFFFFSAKQHLLPFKAAGAPRQDLLECVTMSHASLILSKIGF